MTGMDVRKTAAKENVERRFDFELRQDGDGGDGRTLTGVAAVFDSPARIDSWEGTFDEQFARGAFTKTLQERTPVLQFDHGRDPATGTAPIGAFESITETERGLEPIARLHDNDRVEPIRQAIESGAIDGMSIRFRVIREEWDDSPDVPLRTIREVQLFELGPVVFPAYADTLVGVRSELARLEEPAERAKIIEEVTGEVIAQLDRTDAAQSGTSETSTDAGTPATSGPTLGERDAYLRARTLKRRGHVEGQPQPV